MVAAMQWQWQTICVRVGPEGQWPTWFVVVSMLYATPLALPCLAAPVFRAASSDKISPL